MVIVVVSVGKSHTQARAAFKLRRASGNTIGARSILLAAVASAMQHQVKLIKVGFKINFKHIDPPLLRWLVVPYQ